MTFLGVSNHDSVEAGQAYADELDVRYPLANAPDVWQDFDVPYQPVTIVISAEGAIATRIEGPVSYEGLKQIIEQEV